MFLKSKNITESFINIGLEFNFKGSLVIFSIFPFRSNTNTKEFGYTVAEKLQVGDIVSWSKWSEEIEDWIDYIGILVKIDNKIRDNRLVSVSTVLPIEDQSMELEFFTLTLRLVSRSVKENNT